MGISCSILQVTRCGDNSGIRKPQCVHPVTVVGKSLCTTGYAHDSISCSTFSVSQLHQLPCMVTCTTKPQHLPPVLAPSISLLSQQPAPTILPQRWQILYTQLIRSGIQVRWLNCASQAVSSASAITEDEACLAWYSCKLFVQRMDFSDVYFVQR